MVAVYGVWLWTHAGVIDDRGLRSMFDTLQLGWAVMAGLDVAAFAGIVAATVDALDPPVGVRAFD